MEPTSDSARRARARIARTLIVGGVVALLAQLALVTAPLAVKQIEARRLDELLRAIGAGAGAGVGQSVAQVGNARAWCRASGSVAWLEIPRLRVSAPVREGTGALELLTSVGHVEGTAFPGESGNAVLARHRDGWFQTLADVAVGDSVLVSTPDGRFLYRVSQGTWRD